MIKSLIRPDTPVLNIYAPNNIAMKYMKMKNLEEQEKIDKSIFIVGDCNTSLSVIDQADQKRLRKLMF